MKHKMLVGLLVASLVLTSATTVRAQALEVPAWVPEKVEGWNMVYNGSMGVGGLELGSNDIVKTNWTQVFIKNTSTTLQGVVGVLTIEYTEDFFSKAVPNTVKLMLSYGSFGSLPAFTGNTVWDLFQWMMGLIGSYGAGVVTDEKANVPNSMGAFSLNLTGLGSWDFYLLYAYKANFALMVFAMNFEWNLSELWGYYEAGTGQIKTWFETYVGWLVTAFGAIMTAFATISTGLNMASIPEVADGPITPTGTDVPTSSADVNTVGNAYIGALPGGIPGYPVLLVGIASLFAVLVIVQKKRKAIVA